MRSLPAATMLFATLTAAAASGGDRYVSAALSDSGERLTIATAGGRRFEAPRAGALGEGREAVPQRGYDRPAVSANGAAVGWLALYPNCCTSYPVPLTLVVLDAAGRTHAISGAQSIFEWCFADDKGRRVAIRQAALHGASQERFELRQVSDGARVAEYVIPPQRFAADADAVAPAEDEYEQALARLPRWARCAARDLGVSDGAGESQ